MGLHDREYYQEENASRSGGLLRGHSAVAVLIAFNIIVFLVWALMGGADDPFMGAHFTVSREGILENLYVHTLITSAFSHYDIWHIIFNMLFLYFFGRDLEEIYGPKDFVLFYLVAGFIASVAHIVVSSNPALGASGSVMGIVIACACFYPDKQVSLFLLGIFLPIKIRLRILAIFFVVIDLLGLTHPNGMNIAHAAHLGGALAGYMFYKLDLRFFGLSSPSGRGKVGLGQKILMLIFPVGDMSRLRFGARWTRLFGRKPKLREVAIHVETEREPDPTPTPKAARVDAETAERVDELLKKISTEGIDALSSEERAFLENSSRKYKA